MEDTKIFNDSTYDNMDFVSQCVRPVSTVLNDINSEFPDKYELTSDDIQALFMGMMSYHDSDNDKYGDKLHLRGDSTIKIEHFVSIIESYNSVMIKHKDIFDERKDFRDIGRAYKQALMFNFNLQFRCESDKEISKAKMPILGFKPEYPVEIVKVRNVLVTDKNYLKIVDYVYSSMIREAWIHTEDKALSKAKELIEIMDIHIPPTCRSKRDACAYLKDGLKKIILTNSYNIMNMDLLVEFISWCKLYMRDGNLAAYKNICKIKVMTLEGLPIYSLAEKESL